MVWPGGENVLNLYQEEKEEEDEEEEDQEWIYEWMEEGKEGRKEGRTDGRKERNSTRILDNNDDYTKQKKDGNLK